MLQLDEKWVPLCPLCESKDLGYMKSFEDVEWGTDAQVLPRGIVIKNVMMEYTHCYNCGEDFMTRDQGKERDRNIRSAMVLRIIELEDKLNPQFGR